MSALSKRFWWTIFRILLLFSLLLPSFSFSGCSANACYLYFTELKRLCRMDGSKEGAKLDNYLKKPFRECQIEICRRASTANIKCSDPETHIPGGLDGAFLTCE